MKRFADIQKRNEQLFYFWRGYILFGVLLLICMLPVCIKTFVLLEENVRTNTHANVEKGMDILDNEIATLNNVALDIQAHEYFSYIRSIKGELKPSDYYYFFEMQQKFSDSTKFLSFAKDCMLYFPGDIIFFYDNVYTNGVQDSSKRLSTEKYGKIEELFHTLDKDKYTHAFLTSDKYFDSVNGEFYGIPYVHTYVLANQERNPALVAIFPVESLIELWRLQDLQEIATITVSNKENNEILFVVDNGVTKGFSDIVIDSKKSSLSVKVSIPNSYFIGHLSDLIILGIVYIIGFILIAVVVSIRMAYRNTQKHMELDQEVSRWMLREQILNGLEGRQLAEFKERYRESPQPFRLMIIQLTQTEWSISAAEVKEILAEHHISHSFFSKVKPNLFVMMCTSNNECEKLRQELTQFVEAANPKWNCECLISVGPLYDSLENLKEMYQRVWCDMKCFSERKILFHEDVQEYEKNNLGEMNVLENIQLTDIILSGDESAAVNLIRKQWDKVKKVRNDSMLKQTFFMQFTVLTSVATKLDYDISDTKWTYDDNISVIEDKMIRVTEKLCELVNTKKETAKKEVPKRIVEFMQENYTDPDFYMTTLVEEFELSDKTIAKLIKDYQNMTFSEYLEELRLQKAVRLLNDPANNVRAVAEASGFRSENTFFKAFKRRFGVTPSNYRNNKELIQ